METIGCLPKGIEMGYCQTPIRGETVSGDRLVAISDSNSALIALIDGAGHGKPAADASGRAAAILCRGWRASLEDLVSSCHRGLVKTRGAAINLLGLDLMRRSIRWLGIGEVFAGWISCEIRGKTSRTLPVPSPGIVGYKLPERIAAVRYPLAPVRLLALATDGVRQEFLHGLSEFVESPAQLAAAEIMKRYAKGTDDALIAVLRFKHESGSDE